MSFDVTEVGCVASFASLSLKLLQASLAVDH